MGLTLRSQWNSWCSFWWTCPTGGRCGRLRRRQLDGRLGKTCHQHLRRIRHFRIFFFKLQKPQSSQLMSCITTHMSLYCSITKKREVSIGGAWYLAQRTQLVCWLSEERKHWRGTLQTFTVLSSDAVANLWPSREKWTLRTAAVWALNTLDSPLLQRAKHRGADFKNKTGPPKEWEKDVNVDIKVVQQYDGPAYMLGVHNRTVRSLEDVATKDPEGEKWTPVMASWWPTKRKALALGARFQIIRVLSTDPEATGRRWRKDGWGDRISHGRNETNETNETVKALLDGSAKTRFHDNNLLCSVLHHTECLDEIATQM